MITFFLVLSPLPLLVIASFTENAQFGKSGNFTLSNYASLFQDPANIAATINTLAVAIGATFFSLVIGTFFAFIYCRTNTPIRKWMELAAILPFFLPAIYIAAAWTTLANPEVGLLNRLPLLPFTLDIFAWPWGAIFVMVLYITPDVFLIVTSSLSNMDPSLEEAAIVSGSNRLRTIFRVTMPIILPSLLVAGITTIIRSAEIFTIPLLLGLRTGNYVITTRIYGAIHKGYPADYSLAATFSIFLMILSIVMLLIRARVLGPREYVTVTGKGFRPRLMEIGKWKYLVALLFVAYFVVANVLPLFVIVVGALSAYSFPTFDFSNLVLTQFARMLTTSWIVRAIWNTIFVSLVGATLASFLSLFVSYIVTRTKLRGRRILEGIGMLPMAVPSVVIGVAMLWTYVNIGGALYGTLWLLIIAFITRYLPYGILPTSASLMQIHKELEEGAWASGSSWIYTLRRIILPLSMPGFLSSWIMLYVRFMKEFTVAIFLYAAGSEVIAVFVYDLWEAGQYSGMYALGVIHVLLITASYLGFKLITRRLGVK